MHTSTINIYDVYKEEAATHLNEHVERFASEASDGFLFCFVLFSLQLSVCLWWHDYRRDDFPTLKFGVVMADLLAIC